MSLPNSTIYLDHNATTVLDPRVADAMRRATEDGLYNPSSSHAFGRQSKRRLEDARESILQLTGTSPTRHRLIFTSGGTESNNLAIRGLAGPRGSRIIVSAIEHSSIRASADHLAATGYDVHLAPVDQDGLVRLDELTELLTPETRLVSVMLANHETGAIQPVAEVARRCRERGILIHTDAAQVVGKLPVDILALEVDAMTIAAHKFHGPCGIGGLLVPCAAELRPILFGGSQQLGARPGTESVCLAVGMQEALERVTSEIGERSQYLARLRDRLEHALRALIPSPTIVSSAVPRTPQTLCVAFPGRNRQAIAIALDQRGVACSTGSACASGSNLPSPVLHAMGLAEPLIQGALRFSVGVTTTEDEIDRAAGIIAEVLQEAAKWPVSASRTGRSE